VANVEREDRKALVAATMLEGRLSCEGEEKSLRRRDNRDNRVGSSDLIL
jgi:hypothetical protein